MGCYDIFIMVMHDDIQRPARNQYWVMAVLSEPKYATEENFLTAELDYIKRKLAERRLGNLSWPAMGMFGKKDWRRYEHSLHKYADSLQKYSQQVKGGVVPVKLTIYNSLASGDHDIRVVVKVTDGRIEITKKAPERPPRLDGNGKSWKKFVLPSLTGFSRKQIKITSHSVGAELSALGPRDGAALVNQVLHIHCGPNTRVSYELSSRKRPHEAGEVEFTD